MQTAIDSSCTHMSYQIQAERRHHWFGAKPLSEPMWVVVNWTIQWNMNQNTTIFIKKIPEKCSLQNGEQYVLV